MSTYSQDLRPIALDTPLGADVLLLNSFSGQEEMSRLFAYDLTLSSTSDAIVPKDIIGKSVTFRVTYEDGTPRYFNGIVNRFTYLGTDDRLSHYQAHVVPALWFLSLTSDCRIFQNLTVPDVIKQVLNDSGIRDVEWEVRGSHVSWEYCVQYRETDFNFISRLMEQEGIFYYFRHANNKHTLVLGDKASYKDLQDNDVRFSRDLEESGWNNITSWTHQYEYRSGKWTHTDYNFETPSTDLLATTDTVVKLDNNLKLEVFDYPGEYEKKAEGKDDIRVRMEEEEAGYNVVHGTSMCRSFSPGGKFKISQHSSDAEAGKGYVVTSVVHTASVGDTFVSGGGEGSNYSNTFSCIPDATVFRPTRLTPRPVIHGIQPAVVVGPAGEEIYTDKYGRVRVQFFWDRLGKKNEKSTCWVRVAQPVAGRRWGGSFWPRIGQEVLVQFLEGDPDHPVIIGSVYNAEQMPPYLGDGPDGKHPNDHKLSGFKTNSTPGGKGSNELRFDDTQGKEQVFIHAQQNMDVRVRSDQMIRVVGNRHIVVGYQEKGSLRQLVDQDCHFHTKGSQLELIDKSYELAVGQNLDVNIGADKKELIGGASHLHVKGDLKEKVDGTQSLTVGKDLQEKVGMNYAMDSGQTIHIKGGMTVVIEAGMQLSLKAAGGFIDIGPAGVAISGTMVMINSGGAAGSGNGSSPEAPEDAKKAEPEDPAKADRAVTGQKSAP